MKRLPTPFEYNDHRQFLRDAIKSRGLSYRTFAEKHRGIVSFNTLAGTLSRGKSGLKNKPIRNFSCELLGKVGKALKLKDEEIDFLIMLKLHNDAEPMPGQWGNTYVDSSKRVLGTLKAKHEFGGNRKDQAVDRLSVASLAIAEIVEFFPATAKKRISKSILLETAAILTRQGRKPVYHGSTIPSLA